MKTMTNTKNAQGSSRNNCNLDSRYGEIGIPAVAAAVQYTGDVKQAGPALPQERQDDRWQAEWSADLAA
jgi:hypothetical protein